MKKLVSLAGMLGIVLLFSACSGQTKKVSVDNAKVKELEQQIADLQSENETLKSENEALKAEPKDSEEKEEGTDAGDESKKIKIGKKMKAGGVEVKLNKIEFTYDVIPDKSSGFYTHYEADKGNVYIDIDVDVKNLHKQNLSCDEVMVATADYNNGFTYDSFAIVEDDSTGFTYSNITDIKPLETMGMRFLIKCPQEVEESDGPLFITFKIDDATYKYVIRK